MGRTYVVTSPEMVSALQKAPPALTFENIISEMTVRMNNSDPDTARIIQMSGEDSLYQHYHKIMTLQTLTLRSDVQLGYLAELVNAVQDGFKTELFGFMTRTISVASNRTFFGPQNPYDKHSGLLDRFWEWENGIISMLIGILPRFTARKARNGIYALAEKFAAYEETGGHKDAHPVVRARKEAHLQLGISLMERSKLDAALSFAFNVNASIIAFWVVSNIYSRPDLLTRLRDEIQTNALSQPATLSFARLRDSCPVLNSVYREALRYYAPMSSVRWVKEDTMFAKQYLLRKGTTIHATGVLLHHDKATWGPDADLFNPNRFLHNLNGTKTNPDGSFGEKSKIPSAVFRSFGGGKHMCPGRHFATTEILSLTAVIVLGFEMETMDNSAWNPPPDTKRAPISVQKPLNKLVVRMHRRQGYENVQWKLQL